MRANHSNEAVFEWLELAVYAGFDELAKFFLSK